MKHRPHNRPNQVFYDVEVPEDFPRTGDVLMIQGNVRKNVRAFMDRQGEKIGIIVQTGHNPEQFLCLNEKELRSLQAKDDHHNLWRFTYDSGRHYPTN